MNISGMIGNLFGGGDAEKAAGLQAQGAQQSIDATQGYYNQGVNWLQPYAQSGQAGNNILSQLFTNPQDQQSVYDLFKSSPFYQSMFEALPEQFRQNDGSMAANRLYNSGANVEARNRIAQQGIQGALGNWLGYAQNIGQQGQSASSNLAGFAQNQGLTEAGLLGNKYNALAQQQVASSAIGNDMLGKLIGGVGTGVGYGIGKSDIRLKRDVKRIGTLLSGLPIYAFRFVDDDVPRSGVMAHEAREIFPEAVIEHPDGYLMVDYAQIS